MHTVVIVIGYHRQDRVGIYGEIIVGSQNCWQIESYSLGEVSR